MVINCLIFYQKEFPEINKSFKKIFIVFVKNITIYVNNKNGLLKILKIWIIFHQNFSKK